MSTTTGSFGYLVPKGIKAKNVEVEFDGYVPSSVLENSSTKNGWFGLTVRRSAQAGRWNGCRNIMLTYNPTADDTGASVSYRGYVNYGGASAPTEIKDATQFDGKTEYTADTSEYFDTWVKYKAVATWNSETKTSDYTLYMTPSGSNATYCLGTMHYASEDTDQAGFVSLVFCVTTVYVDNFTMTYSDGDEGGSTEETPEEKVVAVTGLALNKSKASMNVGETLQLSATVYPATATDPSLTWSSSDETVATVDENGLVTALKAGTATITATANSNAEKSRSCTLTVAGTTESADGSDSASTSSETASTTTSSSDSVTTPTSSSDTTTTTPASSDTTATTTASSDATTETTESTESTKKGCSSSVALSASAILTVVGAAFVCSKRRG